MCLCVWRVPSPGGPQGRTCSTCTMVSTSQKPRGLPGSLGTGSVRAVLARSRPPNGNVRTEDPPVLRTFLHTYGVDAQCPYQWTLGGRHYDLHRENGLLQAFTQAVRDTLWGRLARERTLLKGLEAGRDDCTTRRWPDSLKGPPRYFMETILTDAVCTPSRRAFPVGQRSRVPPLSRGRLQLAAPCRRLHSYP